jgi:hypothetical protein
LEGRWWENGLKPGFLDSKADRKRMKRAKRFDSKGEQVPAVPIGPAFKSGEANPSTRAESTVWDEFFRCARSSQDKCELMTDRPMNRIPAEKDLFAEEV